MNVWGIVVAGGTGARYGRRKQFELLRGRRVLDWSIDVLLASCEQVIVVVPADEIDSARGGGRSIPVVAGGTTRSDSVRAGLRALDQDVSHVLVHDAARPLASTELITRVIEALRVGADGVVPVVPVTDSLRTVDGTPVDRSSFVAVQTPQGFVTESLRRAHSSVATATDDASLLAELGLEVVHVEGDPMNLKITDPHDLAVADALAPFVASGIGAVDD